jgi:hypothetical protein
MDEKTEIELLKRAVERHEKQLEDMEQRDQKRVHAALVTLGGAVIAMGTYIWQTVMGQVK